MRVLCIDATQALFIRENQPYTVVDDSPFLGQPVYWLAEIPNQPYLQERFIPIDGPCETELIQQREGVGV